MSTRQLFDHPFFEACEAGLAGWFILLMHGENVEDRHVMHCFFLDMCAFFGVEHEKGQQTVDLMPSCRLKPV